ncbi:MAG: UDP-3-O-acyl-N-acetylglucosamine deacetylase [Elusimicrobiales bacterium]|jgi:UDP-3-O-acyl N-acetylglucosamine deacetylase|nr:UDP-3-O-acyl-N-acetylglucosamine deacetylase [Elusimicrobiales bacterium]
MTRTTLSAEASVEGAGLHTGLPCRAVFRPAAGPTGLRFLLPDGSSPIPALLENVSSTVRGTNLTLGGRTVHTVEHILACCAGLGVHDLDILMDGPEPPAADGSALPFAQAMMRAGLAEKTGQEISALPLPGPVELNDGEAFYRAEPAGGLFLSVVFDHPHPMLGRTEIALEIRPDSFLREIAPARTFGLREELDGLKAAGLAKGGSLDNAMLVERDRILCSGGPRFADEPVRHKALDLLGDLALLGAPLRAAVRAGRTGHRNNVNFAKLLSGPR